MSRVHLPKPDDGDRNVVWVVDGNHSLWDAVTWMDQLEENTIEILSVEEIVKVCARNTIEKGAAIDYLAVFGHGATGDQSAGCGAMDDRPGTKSIRYDPKHRNHPSNLAGPAESYLIGLNGLLSPDAQVLFAGCNVGHGLLGDLLLTTVSKILNCRSVKAFENAQYWWTGTMAGPLKEAKGDSISSAATVLKINGY